MVALRVQKRSYVLNLKKLLLHSRFFQNRFQYILSHQANMYWYMISKVSDLSHLEPNLMSSRPALMSHILVNAAVFLETSVFLSQM